MLKGCGGEHPYHFLSPDYRPHHHRRFCRGGVATGQTGSAQTMKHGKRDTNHAEIKQALKAIGCRVCDLADIGGGVPDLLVGGIDRASGKPILALIEVKTPTGKLTPDEAEFHADWHGLHLFIVRNAAEALAIFGIDDP